MLDGDHRALVEAVLPVCSRYGLGIAGGDAGKAPRASSRFTRAELIAACQAALDDEFSLETLRDQLAFASTYPDEAFTRYGARPKLVAEVKAWALDWSADIGRNFAESDLWSDDDQDTAQDP